jgi:hypothetical protein
LPHYGENSLGPPAVALYHTLELGATVRGHTEAIDNDVADLVNAIARAQPPIDFDRLNRLELPGPAGDLRLAARRADQIASLKPFATRNATFFDALLALIRISSPVAGLCPLRANKAQPCHVTLQLGQGVWREQHALRGVHGCKTLGGLA